MGRDKATLEIRGEPLAVRLGRLLATVAVPALEVGPGWSGLPTAGEDPFVGPLGAIAAGWRSLGRAGFRGDVIVLATDLPSLTGPVLSFLAGHPATVSVVPLVDERPQVLCARWCPDDLDRAVQLVEEGGRTVRGALGRDTVYPGEEEWGRIAARHVFLDADRPQDLPPGPTD